MGISMISKFLSVRLLVFLASLLITSCGMSTDQKQFIRNLGQASSCLTLEGCQGQSRSTTYKSAITIGGTQICPISPSLGMYSHSTNSGLRKICYYK